MSKKYSTKKSFVVMRFKTTQEFADKVFKAAESLALERGASELIRNAIEKELQRLAGQHE